MREINFSPINRKDQSERLSHEAGLLVVPLAPFGFAAQGVALGLVAYGLYMLVRARYCRIMF
jgi:hypothetical protein